MIKAKQRYYLWLLLSMALLGGFVILIFTLGGDMPRDVGMILAISLICVGLFLLLIMLRQKVRDWTILLNGKRVQGYIKSVESNIWLNEPVIIHYTYRVNGADFEGTTWIVAYSLDSVPREGTECQVMYDEGEPEWSVVENLFVSLW
jgi:hypothetical protein